MSLPESTNRPASWAARSPCGTPPSGAQTARTPRQDADADWRALARFVGVQDSYVDTGGTRRGASLDAIRHAVDAMRLGTHDGATPRDVLHTLEQRQADRLCDDVLIVWMDDPSPIALRAAFGEPVEVHLRLEDESARSLVLEGHPGAPDGRNAILRWSVPHDVPPGIHELRLISGGREDRATLLLAPGRCFAPTTDAATATGAFLPLYAAVSETNWGVGDYGDLARLSEWSGRCGCDHFGTLPLLPTFLDDPFDPSPYAPVSRVLHGEVFLDIEPLLGEASPGVRERLVAEGLREQIAEARQSAHVNYAAVWRAKRRALQALADDAFERAKQREATEAWGSAHPHAAEYADFRGAMKHHGTTWPNWRPPTGRLQAERVDESERRLFLWAQQQCDNQMVEADRRAASSGCSLYLDLPIGVHAHGFDAWKHQDLFARGVCLGAPPDSFFEAGQCWGFPPAIPIRSREHGHRAFIDAVRHNMRHRSALRIDHVAGLHRCFWVPEAGSAADGVYVRQPAEEMYAILSILSHQRRARLIGEDLGTVPREVRRTMHRRGLLSMNIAQFGLDGDDDDITPAAPHSLCALNTHDTSSFAGFWSGSDIDDLTQLGLYDTRDSSRRHAERAEMRARVRESLGIGPEASMAQVALALLEAMRTREPAMLLVNLEDLWGESRAHNVPGTSEGNWRRRSARTLESITCDEALARAVRHLARRSRRSPRRHGDMDQVKEG